MLALVKLADQSFKGEVEEYGILPLIIQAALKKAQADQREKAQADAANEILDLLNKKEKEVEKYVNELRSLCAREKSIKAHLEKLDTAVKYGMETSNFLPLAMKVSHIHWSNLNGVDHSLLDVPKDWTPTEKE